MAGDGVGADAMTKLVPDKAEIALEYPEKFYVGTFERSSRFGAHLDSKGFSLVLDRPGSEEVRRSIQLHINYGLFAGILSELASSVDRIPKDDIAHRVRPGPLSGWMRRFQHRRKRRIGAACARL